MRSRIRPTRLARTLAALLAGGLFAAAPLAAQDSVGGEIPLASTEGPLRPGDKIRIHLWQDPELSGEFVVDESGYASLPLLGLRHVIDRPAQAVKRQLAQEYGRQLRNQVAQITMLHRVRVLGAVRDPGLYFADGSMALGDVVAEAGGVAADGDENDVRIERAGRRYQTRLDRGGGFPIHSGDVITVDRKGWLTRNTGIVIGAVVSAITIVVTRR